MTRRGLFLLAAVAVATAALVMAQKPRANAPPSTTGPGAERPASRGEGSEAPVDPAEIRDVLRFAERPAPEATLALARSAKAPAAVLPSPAPDLPRLVGLVRRQGRLLAAFAVDGDVVLAGPGETAAGVTVLEVDEEGVLVRRKDGGEERLSLP